MKLIMTLLVRDEEDIIAANIDYHLSQGVDFFIVTDNLSEDNTREILEGYQQQGVLHIIEEKSDDYSQYRWVTRMARMAFSDYSADWVINNDADEFWWSEKTGESLKSVLAAVSTTVQALQVERKNFLAPPLQGNGENENNFANTMLIREKVSLNSLGNPLPPKVCHRAMGKVDVAQGNHAVSVDGVTIKAVPTKSLIIFHFPLRGYRHFKNKIIKGGRAYERNKQLEKNIGATWRDLYDCYKKGNLEAYYHSQVPSIEEINKGLKGQILVKDTRLVNYLDNIIK